MIHDCCMEVEPWKRTNQISRNNVSVELKLAVTLHHSALAPTFSSLFNFVTSSETFARQKGELNMAGVGGDRVLCPASSD